MYLLKSMSHTSASNVAQYLGVNGRLICSCVACATATQAIGLGCVLNGRGVMELGVAGIAYQKGFIGPGMFSTLVLMGVVTTLLTPFLVRRVFSGESLEQYRHSQMPGTPPANGSQE